MVLWNFSGGFPCLEIDVIQPQINIRSRYSSASLSPLTKQETENETGCGGNDGGVLAGNVQGKSDFGRQVTVYFNDRADVPFDVQGEAKAVAQGMFASIGITIHWRAGSPSEWDKGVIVIEMATGTPATRLPGAMAYALPYEGVHIVIFWDRIKDDSDCRKVLARVMVHEITHVLQGTSHHPDEGIMKAHWNSFEARTLRFTAGDVELDRKSVV